MIIVNSRALVNNQYHQLPPERLADILDATLDTLLELHRRGDVSAARHNLAGVPPLRELEREYQRRQSAEREVE